MKKGCTPRSKCEEVCQKHIFLTPLKKGFTTYENAKNFYVVKAAAAQFLFKILICIFNPIKL